MFFFFPLKEDFTWEKQILIYVLAFSFLSFSSQWERLQCEEGELGQIKGAKYSNC